MATPCNPTICDIAKYPYYCFYSPFGPDANCTLDVCCPEYSVYAYIPGLAPNVALLGGWAAVIVSFIWLGVFKGQWWFVGCMCAGCLLEILGYAGRVWMYKNLWGFQAFIMQVVCITVAPVFFCAAIYVLFARTISNFGRAFLRFNPALFYWVFVSCDIVSLVLQAAGGALSSVSSGKDDTGVQLALVGLALQVITLIIFCGLYAHYLWRYFKSEQFRRRANEHQSFGVNLKYFYTLVSLAIVAILVRCAFRVHELKDGYKLSNEMLHHEWLFISLEAVPIILAAAFLLFGHPGLVFGPGFARRSPLESPSKGYELQNRAE